MMLRRLLKVRKTFIIFFVPYTIMLLLVILVGNFTYAYSVDKVKQNLIRNTFSKLENKSELIETFFKEVDSIVFQLSMDYRIQSFLNVTGPLDDYDYNTISEMVNKIPSLRITNKFIYDIIICFKNSDVLVTPTAATTRAGLLYNTIARYNDLEYEEWKEAAFDSEQPKQVWPATNYITRSQTRSLITYIQTMPIIYKGISKGGIVVLIKEDEIHKIFEDIGIGSNGWAYIADNKNQIITSIGFDREDLPMQLSFDDIKGNMEVSSPDGKFIVVYTTSLRDRWKYVAAIPAEVVLEEVEYIKKIYLLSVFAALAIGIVCAVVFSYRNMKPLKNLVTLTKKKLSFDDMSECDEYSYLNRAINELLSSNTDLSVRIEKNTPLWRRIFFEHLFKVGFNNEADLENSMRSIQLNIAGGCFCAVIAYIAKESEDRDDAENLAGEAGHIFKKWLGSEQFIHELDKNEFAMLWCFPAENAVQPECIEEVLDNIHRDFKNILNINLVFGIGRVYSSLTELRFSFEEAKNAVKYSGECGKSIIWYNDIPQKDNCYYYYPVDIEMKLVNLVVSGEENEVLSILKSIYIKNFIEGKLSDEMTAELLSEIRGTLIKIFKSSEKLNDTDCFSLFQSMADRLIECRTASNFYECSVNIFKQLCEFVNSNSGNETVNMVKNYIETKYMNMDLCLQSIANHFDINEKYLSYLFKNKTGINISRYIENVRMRHAVLIMEETGSTISEIASAVGYTNTNTFYKAFKRVFGTNPKKYKLTNNEIIHTS